MKELFVPYSIAIALKEKGFNEPCLAVYRNLDLYFPVNICGYANEVDSLTTNSIYDDGSYWKSAPLWQQVQDWLRIKHRMVVGVDFDTSHYFWFINIMGKDKMIQGDFASHSDYYNALQDGIEEAFKLI